MHNKDILILSIFTVITVFAWIVLDVYHAAVTSSTTDVQKKLIVPLQPKFDPAVLEQIRSRGSL